MSSIADWVVSSLCQPPRVAANDIEMKGSDEVISEVKRGLFDEAVGEFRNNEDGQPVEGEDCDEPQRCAEDGEVTFMEKECLPEIHTVGKHADVGNQTSIEHTAYVGDRVANTPE